MRLLHPFFNRQTETVAKELIGKVLVYESEEGIIKGIINETEAYTQDDEASHTFKGKTKRNEVMFKEAGHLYIYFTYGMHFCANIVTEDENTGCAVLIRSIIPLEGKEIIKKNRNKEESKDLTNGPGKVCQAYGLSKDYNGIDLTDHKSKIYLEDLGFIPKKILITKRIGISKNKDRLWRFISKEFTS